MKWKYGYIFKKKSEVMFPVTVSFLLSHQAMGHFPKS